VDEEPAHENEPPTRQKTGRTAVPDEPYMGKLPEVVEENGGVVPPIREVA
jgi:hypothetical protein